MSSGLPVLPSGLALMTVLGLSYVVRRARSVFRGWYLSGIGALVIALADAPFYWGLAIWNPVLRNAFGWTAGQMSWAFAITQIEGGFFGPLEGLIVQRLGPRRCIFLGMMLFGLGFVLFSQVQHLWQLYAVFFFISFGSGLSALIAVEVVVNNWFVRHKTRAMAILTEGLAIGGILTPILLAWSIGGIDPSESERFGWRNTALSIGILVMALAVPCSMVVHNRPEDVGLLPDGDLPTADAESQEDAGATRTRGRLEEPGYTLQEAMRARSFWFISLANALSAGVLVTLLVHMGLMLDDRGYSLDQIALVSAVYTGTYAIFILIGGYIGDRFPITVVAFVFSCLQSVSMVVLVLSRNIETVLLFAVLLGIGFGVRTPVAKSLRGTYFGRKAFAAISGLSRVPSSICLFAAPVFAGIMRDYLGSFDLAFWIIAVVSLLGSSLFLWVGDPPGQPAAAETRAVAG